MAESGRALHWFRVETDSRGKVVDVRLAPGPKDPEGGVFHVQAATAAEASKLGRAVYNQYTKLAMRERAKRLKEQGLCRCGRKNDRPGKTRCSACVTRECGYSERRRAVQRGEPVPKLDRLQAITARREADRQSIRRDVLMEVRAAWARAETIDEFARWLKAEIEAARGKAVA